MSVRGLLLVPVALAALPKIDCAGLGKGGEGPSGSTTARSGEVAAVDVPPPPPPAYGQEGLLVDGGSLEGKTPLEQARILEQAGQSWRARLLLQPKALSPTGTPEEKELLKRICTTLADTECLALLDGRAPGADKHAYDAAKKAFAKGRYGEARATLEPRVASGEATAEEKKLLGQVCQKQKDKDCLKALAAK